ncbi:MAG TPA: hypothetical protein PL117_12150, partial [Accumulibacter sp.]|uniref:hypothetical protein n=1 Tax=Accumulibacter sp. TaxID=2053492 RepID=UPI002B6C7660
MQRHDRAGGVGSEAGERQIGERVVAGGIGGAGAEAVLANEQRDGRETDAAAGVGNGVVERLPARVEQFDAAAGLTADQQIDRRGGRLLVAGLAGIEGRIEFEADRRRAAVEREGKLGRRRAVAGRILGEQAEGVAAVVQAAAGESVQQNGRQHEAAVGLQRAAQVDQGRCGRGVERRQQPA